MLNCNLQAPRFQHLFLKQSMSVEQFVDTLRSLSNIVPEVVQ
jgi:hypothetical protein